MGDAEKPDSPTSGRNDPTDASLFARLNGLPPQDENGVDLSLIDWMLSLTPAERIERNYQARLFFERSRGVDR